MSPVIGSSSLTRYVFLFWRMSNCSGLSLLIYLRLFITVLFSPVLTLLLTINSLTIIWKLPKFANTSRTCWSCVWWDGLLSNQYDNKIISCLLQHSSDNNTYFVKVHCPFDVLCDGAEFMNLKMPFKVRLKLLIIPRHCIYVLGSFNFRMSALDYKNDMCNLQNNVHEWLTLSI